MPHAFRRKWWRWKNTSHSGPGVRGKCWLRGCSIEHFSEKKGQGGRVDVEKERWWGRKGGGLGEERKRRSPPAPVIGLPRLSFPRDQSHRNCLLPDCTTNQLLYHPLNSCFSLFIAPSICTETPVVVVQPGGLAGGVGEWFGEVAVQGII